MSSPFLRKAALDFHGASIRARRTEVSLTQAELAERLHVSAQSVSNWERGDSHS